MVSKYTHTKTVWSHDKTKCLLTCCGKEVELDFDKRNVSLRKVSLKEAYIMERVARRNDDEIRKYEPAITPDKIMFNIKLPFSMYILLYKFALVEPWVKVRYV